jgi:predicted aminopeptidase
MLKKGLFGLFIVFVVVAFWQRTLIYYGYVQAKGQLQIVWGARPVQDYLDDVNTPDSIRQKLFLVNKIKKYAVDSLGITPSNNYSSMYDQQGKPLMWVVTASQPFALEPHTWNFPIVGSFPYQGFFDSKMAVKERDRLLSDGLDAGIRNAGGWSTLGWLEDPILSEMLKRNEGQLAELIIHELTHFTLFVKDSVRFNENLASFVGKQGAIKFLKDEFGEESSELKTYLGSENDYDLFVKHFIDGAKLLDGLYKSFDQSLPTSKKLILKKTLIQDIVINVDTITFSQPEKYHHILNSDEVNNTFFLSYIRYRSKQGVFLEEFLNIFGSDVTRYIAYYKSKYPV